jgi:prolyl-tRNA editing enzyme YbaK/EbsC (Cys-tRNA(Pro) deacylase)
MSAERSIRSARIRHELGVQRTRFASREELREMTGLAPGSVPPFGEPVLPFPLFADPSVLARESMIFTAGSRTRSIRIATRDYEVAAKPRIFPFVD